MIFTKCTFVICFSMLLSTVNGAQAKRPTLCPTASWNPIPLTIIGPPGSSVGIPYQTKDQQLQNPLGIALDSGGNILIADIGRGRIQKFHQDGTISIVYTEKDLMPTSLFIDQSDNIYFTDETSSTVKKLSANTYQMTVVAGINNSPGSSLTQLHSPMGIFVDRQGTLYVCDGGVNNRIMKYFANQQGILVIGQGELNTPLAVFVDERGSVYVSDANHHRVVKYAQGQTTGGVTVAGGNGEGAMLNQLTPWALFVEAITETLFVMDMGRVVRWRKGAKEGEVLTGLGQLTKWTLGLEFDAEWNLWVVEESQKRVLAYEFNATSCM